MVVLVKPTTKQRSKSMEGGGRNVKALTGVSTRDWDVKLAGATRLI